MRRISFPLLVSAILFAVSASAQTLVTEGTYSGGEDELTTGVTVSSEGIINLLQSCYAGYTTEAAAVDGYGNFSAAGQFGAREFFGTGIVDPVDVHFIGNEDTGTGTLDIYVVQDSNFAVLTHVVVVLGDLVNPPQCGEDRPSVRARKAAPQLKPAAHRAPPR